MLNPVEVIIHHSDIRINQPAVREFIDQVLQDEGLNVRGIRIILVDDAYLKDLHHKFLNDNTVTDVITFDLGEPGTTEGEVYISVDRARVHAREFRVSTEEEMARLMVHGILHLKGFDDQSPNERELMRKREDYFLNKYGRKIAKFSR